MAITARSENRSSGIVDLEKVLIHFISQIDRSASALVISRAQAMTRRRPDKRLFRSFLSVDCQSVFHLRTSFPRDLGNGLSFSQNSMPQFYFIIKLQCLLSKSMARHKADGVRGDLLKKSILHLDD